MGRSKPRTNKKPPPKPVLSHAVLPPNPGPLPLANLSQMPPLPPLDLPLPPPSGPTVDLNDPSFRSAWQNWTTSALGRLDQLPKLSQAQLNAIAGAAAGLDASVGAGLGGVGGVGGVGQNLGIDLPASLAALFEAKLTLDREKAKLVRMQKELKGYKEAVGQTQALSLGEHDHHHTAHHDHDKHHYHHHHHDHGHGHHGHIHGNGKGKEVVLDAEEDYGECTCHEHEEYYETDEDCYDCDCDCHGCEHDEEDLGEEDEGGGGGDGGRTRRSLSMDDPERFEEAIRELFNWIKAVVWTIEQAAIVAGKKR